MDDKQYNKFALGAYVLFLGVLGTIDIYLKREKFRLEKKSIAENDKRNILLHEESMSSVKSITNLIEDSEKTKRA